MSRQGGKGPRPLDVFDRELGRDWAQRAPTSTLLRLGGIAAPTDYAVRYYRNGRHPKFYQRREVLEKAVRRALSRPTFPDREARVIDMVDEVRQEIERQARDQTAPPSS